MASFQWFLEINSALLSRYSDEFITAEFRAVVRAASLQLTHEGSSPEPESLARDLVNTYATTLGNAIGHRFRPRTPSEFPPPPLLHAIVRQSIGMKREPPRMLDGLCRARDAVALSESSLKSAYSHLFHARYAESKGLR